MFPLLWPYNLSSMNPCLGTGVFQNKHGTRSRGSIYFCPEKDYVFLNFCSLVLRILTLVDVLGILVTVEAGGLRTAMLG